MHDDTITYSNEDLLITDIDPKFNRVVIEGCSADLRIYPPLRSNIRKKVRTLIITDSVFSIDRYHKIDIFPSLKKFIMKNTRVVLYNKDKLVADYSYYDILKTFALNATTITLDNNTPIFRYRCVYLNLQNVVHLSVLRLDALDISITASPPLKTLTVSSPIVTTLQLVGDPSGLEQIDISGLSIIDRYKIDLPDTIHPSIIKLPPHVPSYVILKVNEMKLEADMFRVPSFESITLEDIPNAFEKHVSIPNPVCIGVLSDTPQCRRTSNMMIDADELNMYAKLNGIHPTHPDALGFIKNILPSSGWAKAQYDYINALSLEDRYILQLYTYNGQDVINNYINQTPPYVIDVATIDSMRDKRINHAYRVIFNARGVHDVTIDDIHAIQPYIVNKLQSIIQSAPPLDRNIIVYRVCDALDSIYDDKSFVLTTLLPNRVYTILSSSEKSYNGLYVIEIPAGTTCLLATNTLSGKFDIVLQRGTTFEHIASKGYVSMYNTSMGKDIVSRSIIA